MSIMAGLKAISRASAARRALAATQKGVTSAGRILRQDGTTSVTRKIVDGKPLELTFHNKAGVSESSYRYNQALGSTTRISHNPDGSIDTLTLRQGQQVYHFGAR